VRRLAATVATVAVLAAGCASRTGGEAVAGDSPRAAPSATPSSTTSSASTSGTGDDSCRYTETPDRPAPVGLPPSGEDSAAWVVFATTSGDLPITLNPDQAPCTVHSFTHLVAQRFYDDTTCHRLTTTAGLAILQCGDPDGDGTGGPGYTIPDELPTSLPSAPSDSTGQPLVTYPRGTVAMANAGPNTGGSQFFLVYADSTLPPSYTVFGTLDEDGLATLDAVAARGVAAGSPPEDGPPAQPVTITSTTTR